MVVVLNKMPCLIIVGLDQLTLTAKISNDAAFTYLFFDHPSHLYSEYIKAIAVLVGMQIVDMYLLPIETKF